jgi:hypothetical protein
MILGLSGYSRRRWIFGCMALLFVADIADALIKGVPYLRALGLRSDDFLSSAKPGGDDDGEPKIPCGFRGIRDGI